MSGLRKVPATIAGWASRVALVGAVAFGLLVQPASAQFVMEDLGVDFTTDATGIYAVFGAALGGLILVAITWKFAMILVNHGLRWARRAFSSR